MRIDPKAQIANVRILRVRDAPRRLARGDWRGERLREALRADATEVAAVLAALQREGYVEPVRPASSQHPEHWRATPKGIAFALATARPVSRAAAQRHVDAFLARLAEVRDDGRWLYKARRVALLPAPGEAPSRLVYEDRDA